MFVGCCASKLLGSAVSVEEGDRVPSNSKDTMDTNEL